MNIKNLTRAALFSVLVSVLMAPVGLGSVAKASVAPLDVIDVEAISLLIQGQVEAIHGVGELDVASSSRAKKRRKRRARRRARREARRRSRSSTNRRARRRNNSGKDKVRPSPPNGKDKS